MSEATTRGFGISRRAFSAGLAAAAGGALLGPEALLRAARAQGEEALEIREIAPGVHVITGRGGNTMVATGESGSLLVDCKVAGAGEALRETAQSAGVPVAGVVNTHHHADHTGGNPAFTGDLKVHAHEACADRVRAQVASRGDDPAPFLPNAVAGPMTTLDVAGVKAELRHSGAGHTDNDLFVFLPEKNVLHTGDLVFHNMHPFIDRPAGATTAGWMESCDAMLSLCDAETVVVPGHGEVGDRTAIEKQIAYFEAVRAAIGEIVASGGPKQAASRVRLPIFEGMGFERLRVRSMEAVYDELVESRED